MSFDRTVSVKKKAVAESGGFFYGNKCYRAHVLQRKEKKRKDITAKYMVWPVRHGNIKKTVDEKGKFVVQYGCERAVFERSEPIKSRFQKVFIRRINDPHVYDY